MRTTLDIEAPVLADLRKIQKVEKKSLGQIVSELLTLAIKQRGRQGRAGEPPLRWISKPLGMKVDISDKEAVAAVFDAEKGRR